MPRHSSLADQLKTVLEYRNRPRSDEPIEPLQTNWRITPDNDINGEDVEGMHIERRWEIAPSIKEIERSLKDVVFEERAVPRYTASKSKAGRRTIELVPVDGDIERRHTEGHGNVVTRLGKLHFSDGTQTEAAHKLSIDGKVVMFNAPMPVGAMMNTKDKETSQQKGSEETRAWRMNSNEYFAATLDVEEFGFVPGKRKRKGGVSISHAEARRVLAEAYANTPDLPPVKRCPDGLPCAHDKIADNFVGMKKSGKGNSGMQSWEDLASALAKREVWEETLARLSDQDVAVLDAAIEAPNMHAVGTAVGMGDFYARNKGGGKRALLAANDNLRKARKMAA